MCDFPAGKASHDTLPWALEGLADNRLRTVVKADHKLLRIALAVGVVRPLNACGEPDASELVFKLDERACRVAGAGGRHLYGNLVQHGLGGRRKQINAKPQTKPHISKRCRHGKAAQDIGRIFFLFIVCDPSRIKDSIYTFLPAESLEKSIKLPAYFIQFDLGSTTFN